ncbi:hypothetical protein BGX21_010802 [Mortierella sp. AD011]|nr:hypothetical protein BGX21_010802 [Mortierella sp. AD011]
MTSVKVKLFCILDGDSTAFSVKIEPEDTVDDPKKKIKEEKSPEYDDIVPSLACLRSNCGWGGGNTNCAYKLCRCEETSRNKRDLRGLRLKSTKEDYPLRKLFNKIRENAQLSCVHVAIQNPEHLESSKKDVVCTYATDNKLATVDQLRKLLHQHFEQFDGDDYVQIFAYQPGISKPVWLADDIVLRSCLEQAKENDLKNLTISLNSPAKSFSIYTWKEMMEQYRVGAGPEFPPSFDIQPRSMNDDEKIMLEEIVKECTRRNEAYISGPSSSEFTRNTIVDAFMVGAMQSYKADMFLA